MLLDVCYEECFESLLRDCAGFPQVGSPAAGDHSFDPDDYDRLRVETKFDGSIEPASMS